MKPAKMREKRKREGRSKRRRRTIAEGEHTVSFFLTVLLITTRYDLQES
jgi:hypothetical protein